MWQGEADTELTLSASPATAVGQLTLTLANWRYSTVCTIVMMLEIKTDLFMPGSLLTLFLKSIDGYHIQETGALCLHWRTMLKRFGPVRSETL